MKSKNSRHFSIEFYPPRSKEGINKLDKVHAELVGLNPNFFSVTYGAGGSTKEGTKNLVLDFKKQGSNIAPHLSFIGTEEMEIRELLNNYSDAGISRIVALRGDLPSGSPISHRYASELVEFIREESGERFHIDVACYPEMHPESLSIESEVAFFKKKVDAGANSAITQYFYNTDSYFRYCDYCNKRGITIPIVPGIMPITNYQNLSRFSRNCGAEIPRWLRYRLEELTNDKKGLQEFGIDVVSDLCEKLLSGGAPGLHFYSMNLSRSITRIWNNLGLSERK